MTTFKGLPPRVRIRARDNDSTYPLNKRTGDMDRLGSDVDTFDDRRTIVFQESTVLVNYPQMLPTESIHYDTNIATDMTQLGRVRAGVSDHFLTSSRTISNFEPYHEANIPEFGQTSDMWLTGTDAIVGPGFTQQLRDKTIIRLQYPLSTATTLNSLTASMMYYDTSTRTFAVAGAGSGDEYTNPGALGAPYYNAPFGPVLNNVNCMNAAGNDARLFGPFGNVVLTGSNAFRGYTEMTIDTYQSLSINSGTFAKMISTTGPDAALLNSSLAATVDQQLTIPEIQHPFLLEKIHVKIPIRVSASWFNDRTSVAWLAFLDVDRVIGSKATGSLVDVGGPCVTFALQRQSHAGHRELIASATVIPSGDNTQSFWNQTHLKDLKITLGSGTMHTTRRGFASYATPTVVIEPDLTNAFTGTISFMMVPAVSNGIVAIHSNTGINDGHMQSGSFEVYDSGSLADSLVVGINPFGRAMDRVQSARSYFGKEHVVPDFNNFTPLYTENATLSTYVVQQTAISPYVILPNDKFIFSVSKYRPVRNQHATGSSGGYLHSASDIRLGYLSGSHHFMIESGNIEISLYGSNIRNSTEFHDTLNQQLSSLAAHEALISDVVGSNQFIGEARSTYSGTLPAEFFITNAISGADMRVAIDTSATRYTGQSISSTFWSPAFAGYTGKIGSLQRFKRYVTNSERYYDSMTPLPAEIQKSDDADIVMFGYNYGIKHVNMLALQHIPGNPGDVVVTKQGEAITFNTHWPYAYPFEPRYHELNRYENNANVPDVTTAFYTLINGAGSSRSVKPYNSSSYRVDSIMRIHADQYKSLTSSLDFLQNSYGYGPSVGSYGNHLHESVFAKGFFGIGNDLHGQPEFRVSTLETFTDTDRYMMHYSRTCNIRGWKYGLISGMSMSPSVVFRHDHYGHMRDMLEPRLFSRMSTRMNRGTQGPVHVRFTLPDPADTNSSNLSSYATSSLPYFDGVARNRNELPDTSLLQLDIPEF